MLLYNDSQEVTQQGTSFQQFALLSTLEDKNSHLRTNRLRGQEQHEIFLKPAQSRANPGV